MPWIPDVVLISPNETCLIRDIFIYDRFQSPSRSGWSTVWYGQPRSLDLMIKDWLWDVMTSFKSTVATD